MHNQPRAVAFDVDAVSLAAFREALPEWLFDVVYGATVTSLPSDWDAGDADLLVVGVRTDVSETLGICRLLTDSEPDSKCSHAGAPEALRRLRNQELATGPAVPPLLLLIPRGHESLARAALEAGAESCLFLPVVAGEVRNALFDLRQIDRARRYQPA